MPFAARIYRIGCGAPIGFHLVGMLTTPFLHPAPSPMTAILKTQWIYQRASWLSSVFCHHLALTVFVITLSVIWDIHKCLWSSAIWIFVWVCLTVFVYFVKVHFCTYVHCIYSPNILIMLPFVQLHALVFASTGLYNMRGKVSRPKWGVTYRY